MAVFEYTSLTKSGRQERGAIDADSPANARRKLRAANVHVLSLREGGKDAPRPAALAARTIRLRRIGARSVAVATRQLATLLRAGMPLVPALTAMAEQLADEPMGAVIASVRDAVNEGGTLAAALSEHPRVFSELYVNMAGAGEAAGALDDVLLRLAETTEKRVNLMNKVRAALAYPILMSVVGVGVVVFLLSFVIPSIGKLFAEMNRDLPWPTVALIALSGFIHKYLLALVAAAVALLVGFKFWIKTPGGRVAWDGMKLRLPLFGDLTLKSAVALFARTLGVLLASGVAILDALDIVKRVVGNAVLSSALEAAGDRVRQGESIANSLSKSGLFPPILLHMVAAGEASGKVEDGLLYVAEAYDNEVEAKVGGLTSLLEPVLIILMGAVVGFIVLAILLPIFDINQAIR
ncbi:MAG: type II secretion system inner membrane protein GspF [Planctomycetes bacterium]|nr:type II secretion system inner membrane protein GspF [Planctomycetota bacterium]